MNYSREYIDYLQSKLWQERRLATLEAADFRCRVCGENDRLEVHHLTYVRLGCEQPSDLLVLCKSHHWMADKERQDPGYIERTLSQIQQSKKPISKKPTYCYAVIRWHRKAKVIRATLDERKYLTRKEKDKLAELEKKFESHMKRCPICLGNNG